MQFKTNLNVISWVSSVLIMAFACRAECQTSGRSAVLLERVKFDIIYNGAVAGSTGADTGTRVTILQEKDGKMLVGLNSLRAWIDKTKLETSGTTAGPTPVQSIVNRFNYILGTQTVGGKYHFTDKTALVETAGIIHNLGATSVKFEMGPGYRVNPSFHSLVDFARDEPSVRQVLDMPFANYQLWISPFGTPSAKKSAPDNEWQRQQSKIEYREVYDLVTYLLNTYNGSGKTFFLGHWEGDNMLRGGISKEKDARVTPEAVQKFIAWLTVRQKAVDDAKHDTPHGNVQVWHYTEINHPTISLKDNRPSIVNMILPHVPVDFVSYSSYDVTNEPQAEKIKAVLDYIESKLTPKPGIPGKRVFIGEYGYPTISGGKAHLTPQEQNERSMITMRAALEWGCPFILYWQVYNNEIEEDGRHRGFWLIDEKNVKQPIYETHRLYYVWARKFVTDVATQTGKPPSPVEFQNAAAAYLNTAIARRP